MKRNNALVFAYTILGLLLSLFMQSAVAGDIYVIANKAVTLDGGDVRDVFVGDKQSAGGTKLVPVDNAALQKDFLDKVVKMDAAKYGNVWTKKGFRDGLNPPPTKSGDAEVIAFVKATPGAVAYVSSAPPGVTVVQKY